jgi:hypothetical protein
MTVDHPDQECAIRRGELGERIVAQPRRYSVDSGAVTLGLFGREFGQQWRGDGVVLGHGGESQNSFRRRT